MWTYSAGQNVNDVDISANGSYIVASSWDSNVYLFNKTSSTPEWSYSAGDQMYDVSISDDGEYIVAGSRDYYSYFFHRSSNTPIWDYNTGRGTSTAISANSLSVGFG